MDRGGRGADVTIEATNSPAAVLEGMEMTRDNGRYVIVGQYTDAGTFEINPHWDLNREHIEIRGCWGTELESFVSRDKGVGKVWYPIWLRTIHQPQV